MILNNLFAGFYSVDTIVDKLRQLQSVSIQYVMQICSFFLPLFTIQISLCYLYQMFKIINYKLTQRTRYIIQKELLDVKHGS